MFKNRYRVVSDYYAGYKAQVRYWFLPFWFQIGGVNTYTSLEQAKARITGHKQIIYYEE